MKLLPSLLLIGFTSLVALADVEKREDSLYEFRGLVSFSPHLGTLAYVGTPDGLGAYKNVLFKPACMSDDRFEGAKKSYVEMVCEGRESGGTLVLTSVVEVRTVGEAQWVPKK